MSETTNYKLHLTDDSSEKFIDWREAMNGTNDSNMIKIDTALGEKAEKSNLDAVVAKISPNASSTNKLVSASEMGDAIEAVEARIPPTAKQTAWDAKQDEISDLETIRSGAAAGVTAVQPEIGKGLFSGNYDDLTNKPKFKQYVSWGTNARSIYDYVQQGYIVYCKDGHDTFLCYSAYYEGSTYYAYFMSGNHRVSVKNSAWTKTAMYLEITSYKVTSLSESSTDLQYPSAKCVYDALATKAETEEYSVSIGTAWTQSGSYYVQNVTMSGILATDNPIVDVVLGADETANEAYLAAWGNVQRITTEDNAITLYATAQPQTAFMLKIKVVR